MGSKLMAKMGYKPGEPLGRSGTGIIEPIAVQILPAGTPPHFPYALVQYTHTSILIIINPMICIVLVKFLYLLYCILHCIFYILFVRSLT